MTDSEIIDALGGAGEVARRLGVRSHIVSGWRVRGISYRARGRILALAGERGIDLPPDFLIVQRPEAA